MHPQVEMQIIQANSAILKGLSLLPLKIIAKS